MPNTFSPCLWAEVGVGGLVGIAVPVQTRGMQTKLDETYDQICFGHTLLNSTRTALEPGKSSECSIFTEQPTTFV